MCDPWNRSHHTRRSFIATALAIMATTRRAPAAPPADRAQQRTSRRHLSWIRSWGCQYQELDLPRIAASDLDLIVIDLSLDDDRRRFLTPAERASLQRKPDGSRRIVLAYLCVGETDVKRWYWPRRWRESSPAWVGPANPDWTGARHVRFWHREWQSMVFRSQDSILSRILDIGFDGVLLDRVDAYLDWQDERPSAPDDMIDLVADLAAVARSRHPGFILLVQNAEYLLARPRYVELIDAHNKESLLTGLRGKGVPNEPAEIDWSLVYLNQARAAGVKMLATEYLSDPAVVSAVRQRLVSLGFVPFFGVRALDRLPVTQV